MSSLATNLVMSMALADRAGRSALKRFLLKQSLTDGAYTSALKTKASQIAHLGLFVFAKATDANRGCFETRIFDPLKKRKKGLKNHYSLLVQNSFSEFI